MSFDNHKNFAYSSVAVAPTPALTGNSLTLNAGDGSLMPTPPFNASVWPSSVIPLATNAEIVRVTAIAGDALTISRSQESSSARVISVGDQFSATITTKTLTDVETQVTSNTSALSGLAQLASPAFTGTPTAPTASVGTNTTQVATTAFVLANEASAATPATFTANGTVKQTAYNVRDYGAVGNGTTDDTSAIQAAITAAVNGGIVYLSAATYKITASLVLTSGVGLAGDGANKTILTGNFDSPLVKTTKSGTTKNLYTNISINNIKFSSQFGHCMVIYNTSNLRVTNCEYTFTVTSPIRESLWVEYCQFVVIQGNYLHDLTGNGIQVNATDYFEVSNNNINGGSSSTQDDGIDIDCDFLDTAIIPSRWGVVSNNTVQNIPNGCGIRVEDSQYITVSSNVITNIQAIAGVGGIQINQSATAVTASTTKQIVVSNNTISNCVTAGISTTGTTLFRDIILTNNILENCGQTGGSNIRAGLLLNGPNVTALSNYLYNCGTNNGNQGAIVVYQATSTNITALNNTITNSPIAVRFWNGNGTTTYTNVFFKGNKLINNIVDYTDATQQVGVVIDQPYAGTNTLGTVTGSPTFNYSLGDVLTATLGGNISPTVTTAVGQNTLWTWILTQDGTGSRTISVPSNVKVTGGSLALSSTPGAVDIYTFRFDGTNWREVSRSLAAGDVPAATFTTSGIVKQTVYNVRDYGAVGDGVTDDRAAIQSAIDACNTAGGGVIYFPAATYSLAGSLYYRGYTATTNFNITFKGAGRALSVLLLATGVATATGSNHIRQVVAGSYNSVETPLTAYTPITNNTFNMFDMTLDYNGANQTVNSVVGGLILDNRGQNCLIQNCGFRNVKVPTFNRATPAYGIGLNNYDSRFAKIISCVFENCDEGLWETTYAQGNSLEMVAIGNRIYNSTDAAIYYESGIGSVITGNIIDTASYGIECIVLSVSFDSRATISGNSIQNTTTSTIHVNSPRNGLQIYGNAPGDTDFLGIGTDSPGAQLNITSTGTNTQQLRFGLGSNSWEINRDNISTGRLRFMQNSGSNVQEPLSILATGQVGIGGIPAPTAWEHLAASTTANASLRIAAGVAPTAPNSGDVWFDGTHLQFQNGSTTDQLDNQSFSGSTAGGDLSGTYPNPTLANTTNVKSLIQNDSLPFIIALG